MSGSSTAGWAGAEGGGPKLDTDESLVPEFPAAGSDPMSPVDPAGSLDLPRAGPMVSAGSAGMPSTSVASTGAGRAGSPAAAAPFAVTSPPALPSEASSPDAGFAGAGLRAGLLGGAMMSLVTVSSVMSADWVSWSSIRSSPVAREVTMVGEPPPRPPDLSVRLSKPSSL